MRLKFILCVLWIVVSVCLGARACLSICRMRGVRSRMLNDTCAMLVVCNLCRLVTSIELGPVLIATLVLVDSLMVELTVDRTSLRLVGFMSAGALFLTNIALSIFGRYRLLVYVTLATVRAVQLLC